MKRFFTKVKASVPRHNGFYCSAAVSWRYVGGNLPDIPLVSVIDNKESVAWPIARTVRSAGYCVEVFTSAEEFLGSEQILRTACLVLGSQLKGMSGLQLQSHLASAGRHIPIIFFSAATDEGARALAFKTGVLNVLDNPSGNQALLKEISLILKPRDTERRTSLPSSGRDRS